MESQLQVVLTGASGMVGREILSWLLSSTNAYIWILAHNTSRWDITPQIDSARARVLHCNILEPNLGLSEHDLRSIRLCATDIVHAAGSTDFGTSIEEARLSNLVGTQNVLALATSCTRLVRFGHISTAYVAGRRNGTVREDELHHASGFVNAYEQSKYETEMWLAHSLTQLPVATYRLSTLIGNSTTGATTRFTAPHQLIRFVYLGLVSMLPGYSETRIDLVSTDHIVDTLCTLHFKHFAPRRYHLTAGRAHSLSTDELISITFETLTECSPGWAGRHIERPLLVDRDTFALFLRSVKDTANPLFLQVITNTKTFADQLTYPKDFDSQNVVQIIPEYYQNMPPVRQTFKRMVQYCVQTNWGRSP